MAQLLRAADRRFRDEHQPDILRRAGHHLSALTAGRYHRLMVDESSGDGRFQSANCNRMPLVRASGEK